MDRPMATSGTGIVDILLYGGGIILLILVFYATILWLCRRVRSVGDGVQEPAFTVDWLEQMLADGRISRQEFDVLRQNVVNLGGNDMEKRISMSSHPGNVDDDNDKRSGDTRRPDKE